MSTHFAFESAIGLNGLVWIRVSEPAHFLAAKMVLEAADRQWLGDHGFDLMPQTQSGTAAPEKKVGDAGRKMASRWGNLDDKDVRNVVQRCLE